MISLNQTLKVLKNYMRVLLRYVPAGISTGSENAPVYACDKYGLPPICKESQKHVEVRKTCRVFYNSLSLGEHKVVCPFGINISYLKTNNTPMLIGFFLQTGFTPEAFSANTITNLNRVPKKAIKKAIEATSLFKFSSSDESATLNLLRRTLETMLAGRVAASMRVLTHQILTPVQGVMSDLQEIKYKHEKDSQAYSEKTLMLMQSNIEEINSIAKQIHVLLSEDVTPSRQRIRKVVVHKIIKKACERLESVATKKDLSFNIGYNNGIIAVEAVPDQLDIVFRCLLDNAAKYSFLGRADNKRTIDIHYDDTRLNSIQALKVSIQNFGCPITKEEIEQRLIFELGYRGHFSGDRGRQGTGSGLCIVDRIVEAHFGKIEVESKIYGEQEGVHQAVNTFTVFWPRDFPYE